jgi:carbamoyltransferase
MLILGINAYHGDSSACLMRDGELVAAAEEERFRRVKHWAGLPSQAISWCLQDSGARFSDIDHIAINRKPGSNNLRRALFVLRHRPALGLVLNRVKNIRHAAGIEETLRQAFPAEPLRAVVHHVEHHLAHLASAFLVSPFEDAVCLSVDGFGDFASAAWGMGSGGCIRIDGRVYFPHSLGIFYSAITQWLGFPHFGDEYKVMGLAPYGKPTRMDAMREIVRVLPGGDYELNLRFFRHHTENVAYSWHDCAPEVGVLYTPALEELLGPARKRGEPLEQKHHDIARSAQAMYEEAFFALLNSLHARYQCPNLALSGGCAMNSVANGKVYLNSPFRKMYLPAAAGDAGGAIGAAFAVWEEVRGSRRMANGVARNGQGTGSAESSKRRETRTSKWQVGGESDLEGLYSRSTDGGKTLVQDRSKLSSGPVHRFQMVHAYTGPESGDEVIEALLRSRGLLEERTEASRGNEFVSQNAQIAGQNSGKNSTTSGSLAVSSASSAVAQAMTTRYQDAVELCRRAAVAISQGKVVGWFQGRMEWGPRALGNRSILGDPRRADMKEILNAKIKRRESFRPFAPSILRERVGDWFEQDDDVPFMMQVFQVREDKRRLVPATTHVDGSGRLHTVRQEANPLYHRLISEFELLTGVPMVLNTSFNENEPVVCRPEEALDCFLRTKMDVLVLGKFYLERTLSPIV